MGGKRRRKYIGGQSSVFLLHRNVFDRVLHGGRFFSTADFIGEVLLGSNKENIIAYDPSSGVRFLRSSPELERIEDLRLKRRPRDVLPLLEAVIYSLNSTAVITSYASAVFPAGELNMLSDQDRISIVTLHRWSLSRELASKDNVVFLLAESVSEVHSKLVANPMVSAIEIPVPELDVREQVIRHTDPSIDARHVEMLAEQTAGLRSVQIQSLLTPDESDGMQEQERLKLIERLLGNSADTTSRAKKLSRLTRGMGSEEIHHLINPDMPVEDVDDKDPYKEVIELVNIRKREIIEKECAGLIEFINPRHDLSAVGGQDAIKDELRQIAGNIREGDHARVPMGLLFVGPMGCGKTFVANAFVKESGLTAIRLKNFPIEMGRLDRSEPRQGSWDGQSPRPDRPHHRRRRSRIRWLRRKRWRNVLESDRSDQGVHERHLKPRPRPVHPDDQPPGQARRGHQKSRSPRSKDPLLLRGRPRGGGARAERAISAARTRVSDRLEREPRADLRTTYRTVERRFGSRGPSRERPRSAKWPTSNARSFRESRCRLPTLPRHPHAGVHGAARGVRDLAEVPAARPDIET